MLSTTAPAGGMAPTGEFSRAGPASALLDSSAVSGAAPASAVRSRRLVPELSLNMEQPYERGVTDRRAGAFEAAHVAAEEPKGESAAVPVEYRELRTVTDLRRRLHRRKRTCIAASGSASP